jgi:hypothetical protein
MPDGSTRTIVTYVMIMNMSGNVAYATRGIESGIRQWMKTATISIGALMPRRAGWRDLEGEDARVIKGSPADHFSCC